MRRILLGIGLLGIGFGQETASVPRGNSRSEFTVQMSFKLLGMQLEHGSTLPIPYYREGQIVQAVRGDGASAFSTSGHRTVFFPAQRRMVTVNSQVRVHPNMPLVSFLNQPSSDPVCADSARTLRGPARFDGWEQVLGVKAARYESNWGDSRTTAYFAPELGCFRVKQIDLQMIWHGIPLQISMEEATRIERGRVDPALFEVPQSAASR